jgi:hypothetical protein
VVEGKHDGGDTLDDARRIAKVEANPTIPLMRNNQPKRTITARLATIGTATASSPNRTRMIPSIRNSRQ